MIKALGSPEEQSQASSFYKTLLLLFVSGLLLLLDARFEQTKLLRRGLEYVLTPSYLTLNFLVKQQQAFSSYLSFNKRQSESLATLKQRNIRLEEMLAAMRSMEEENEELKRLLNYRRHELGEVSLPARILGQKLTGRTQEVVVDKGRLNSVREGMPVVTNEGLVGQVILTGPFTSRILLITDIRHATPVMVDRNNNRFILSGLGDASLMLARDVDSNVDVRIGDRLVTSGLGGVFRPGLSVAEVISIDAERSRSFRQIWARPLLRPHITQFVLMTRRHYE